MKKFKKKSVPLDKLLLDTSIQLERLKLRAFDSEISKLASQYRLTVSNYVVREFRLSALNALIDFYHLVEITHDVEFAIATTGDKHGRGPKYGMLLWGILYRVQASLDPVNITDALRELEAAIIISIQDFDKNISHYVGDFSNDQIINFPINSRDDFKPFQQLCNNNKILFMTEFWERNTESLNKLVQDLNFKSAYPKMHEKLEKISIRTSEVDRLQTVNRGIGDAVISTDAPKNYILTSIDKSFSIICPILSKPYKLLPKITVAALQSQ